MTFRPLALAKRSSIHTLSELGYTSLEQTYTLLEISAPVSRIKLHIPGKKTEQSHILNV